MKYTNPGRGILNFCKQVLSAPHMQLKFQKSERAEGEQETFTKLKRFSLLEGANE